MDKQYGTDAEALASTLICTALLDQLVSKTILTRDDVRKLLRRARNALEPTSVAREIDAGWLIDKLISRYPQNI